MNKEQPLSTNFEISEVKKHLKELEISGDYVFHGSPFLLDELEPRQAFKTPDLRQQDSVPDGDPCVAATPYADLSIFRSLVNGKNITIPHSSSFGINGPDGKEQLRLAVSPNVLPQLEGKKGYVYVLSRKDFISYEDEQGMEWRAHEKVNPIEVIEVTARDLPAQIEALLED
ncbi:MAG: hypothetical protein V1846_05225 [Candidatus Komeilibacteria bacterium]